MESQALAGKNPLRAAHLAGNPPPQASPGEPLACRHPGGPENNSQAP
jgi:hypothetical protein